MHSKLVAVAAPPSVLSQPHWTARGGGGDVGGGGGDAGGGGDGGGGATAMRTDTPDWTVGDCALL